MLDRATPVCAILVTSTAQAAYTNVIEQKLVLGSGVCSIRRPPQHVVGLSKVRVKPDWPDWASFPKCWHVGYVNSSYVLLPTTQPADPSACLAQPYDVRSAGHAVQQCLPPQDSWDPHSARGAGNGRGGGVGHIGHLCRRLHELTPQAPEPALSQCVCEVTTATLAEVGVGVGRTTSLMGLSISKGCRLILALLTACGSRAMSCGLALRCFRLVLTLSDSASSEGDMLCPNAQHCRATAPVRAEAGRTTLVRSCRLAVGTSCRC